MTRDSGASVSVARVKAARDELNRLINHGAEVTTGTVRDPKDADNIIAYAEVNPLRLMEFVMSTGPNLLSLRDCGRVLARARLIC